jgi:uncharacterized protein
MWLSLSARLTLIYFAVALAIVAPVLVRDTFHLTHGGLHEDLALASCTAIFVLFAVLATWMFWDRRPLRGIGVHAPANAVALLLLGASIPFLLLALPVLVGAKLGWMEWSIPDRNDRLVRFIAGAAIVLLAEAIPEEFAFRGYIYGTLATVMPRWTASIITLTAFVGLPLPIYVVYFVLFGQAATFGGHVGITWEYMIVLIPFGIALQYLRVLTGSVWACIGFHAAFLHLARTVNQSDSAIIQLTPISSMGSGVLVLASIALVTILLLVIPYARSRGRTQSHLRTE